MTEQPNIRLTEQDREIQVRVTQSLIKNSRRHAQSYIEAVNAHRYWAAIQRDADNSINHLVKRWKSEQTCTEYVCHEGCTPLELTLVDVWPKAKNRSIGRVWLTVKSMLFGYVILLNKGGLSDTKDTDETRDSLVVLGQIAHYLLGDCDHE